MSVAFEWDSAKNISNRHKHGITFEEAQTVFYDQNARILPDPDHSENEERVILLGLSLKLRIVAVCHCYRSSESIIRIISARRASKAERLKYEELLP